MRIGTTAELKSLIHQTGNYNQLPKEFQANIELLTPRAVYIYIYLMRCREFLSCRDIANKLDISKNTASKGLDELARLGFIIHQDSARYGWNLDRHEWGQEQIVIKPERKKKLSQNLVQFKPALNQTVPKSGTVVSQKVGQLSLKLSQKQGQSAAPTLLLNLYIKSLLKWNKKPASGPLVGQAEKKKQTQHQTQLPLKTLIHGEKYSVPVSKDHVPNEIASSMLKEIRLSLSNY